MNRSENYVYCTHAEALYFLKAEREGISTYGLADFQMDPPSSISLKDVLKIL